MSQNDSQRTGLTIAGIVLGAVLLGPYLGYNLLGNGPESAMRVSAPGTYSSATDPLPARREPSSRENRDIDASLDLPRKPISQPAIPVREPVRKDTGKGSGKLSEIENLLR